MSSSNIVCRSRWISYYIPSSNQTWIAGNIQFLSNANVYQRVSWSCWTWPKKLWVHKGTPGQLTRPRNGSQWWIYCSRCVWYRKIMYIHGGLNVRYDYLKRISEFTSTYHWIFVTCFHMFSLCSPYFFLQTCFQCSFFRYIFPYVSQNTFGVFPTLLCPIRK